MTIQTVAPTVKALYSVINKLAKVENVTRTTLAALAKDICALHLHDSPSKHDVGVVNRLLQVLTKANQKCAIKFFTTMLPYRFDDESMTFGKLKLKESVQTTHYLRMAEFLHDPEADFWSWVEENIQFEQKPVNYLGNVSKAVAKAIEKEGDKAAVIRAVLEGGLTVDELLAVMDSLTEPERKAA